jgi:hypothetical protein
MGRSEERERERLIASVVKCRLSSQNCEMHKPYYCELISAKDKNSGVVPSTGYQIFRLFRVSASFRMQNCSVFKKEIKRILF